jgi:hypothetical protein
MRQGFRGEEMGRGQTYSPFCEFLVEPIDEGWIPRFRIAITQERYLFTGYSIFLIEVIGVPDQFLHSPCLCLIKNPKMGCIPISHDCDYDSKPRFHPRPRKPAGYTKIFF